MRTIPGEPSTSPAPWTGIEQNVVCLNASVGGETIDFTGFVINRDGMIVSTAHDLDGIRDVTVSFDNGQKLGGEIVRRDPARDLSLIRVAGPLAGVIPVNGGRDRLKRGEKVFFPHLSRP